MLSHQVQHDNLQRRVAPGEIRCNSHDEDVMYDTICDEVIGGQETLFAHIWRYGFLDLGGAMTERLAKPSVTLCRIVGKRFGSHVSRMMDVIVQRGSAQRACG